MLSEIPGFVMAILNAIFLLAFICTSCLVVDTYIRVREWLHFKASWGESIDEISTLGTSEETEE